MASRSLGDLKVSMGQQALTVIRLCETKGVDILVYCTWREMEEQAKLYRQSRTGSQIQKKIEQLSKLGYPEFAHILDEVGPQQGRLGKHVTCAGPGESWHNFRFAFDAVPIVNGKAMWDAKHPSWQIYGECVRNVGLYWAGDWTRFKEYPHAQFYIASNPLKAFSHEEIAKLLGGPIA